MRRQLENGIVFKTVDEVETLKSKYTQNLTELENFYGSLSQRAFKGELDLGRVIVES
jgi:type I restriction enzyme, S subunit